MMLVSRAIPLVSWKLQQRCIVPCSRRLLSHLADTSLLSGNARTQRRSMSTTKKQDGDDNNEWLWAYLRDRQSFVNLNEEQRRRVIEIEIQTLREAGERVPDMVPEERWAELVKIPTIEARKTLYGYLFLREMHRKRRAAVVASNDIRRAEAAKRRAGLLSEGKPPTNYPGYSSIFRHLGRQQEKYLREQLLLPPARLGEMLVIDCGFEQDHAREYYLSTLVDQIQYLSADLTRYHSPSFVYLCNLSSNGLMQAEFARRSSLENMCFEATPESYLDIFPHEKLIYLSPDSSNEMTSFDHDAVYILGGIADLTGKKPLTFAKAKREHIRHQRLPIDRYVKFGGGSGKSLTLDQMYNILMTLKHTGSWAEAFKYIPDRKVVERYSDKVDRKQLHTEQFGRRIGLNV